MLVCVRSALARTACKPGLFAKRLARHRFVWPPLVDGGVVLTSSARFAPLVEAMDRRRTVAPAPPRVPMQMAERTAHQFARD